MPDPVPLLTFCRYLTDTTHKWRGDDYSASKMVKALKGDPINGYFRVNINKVARQFNANNIADFVTAIPLWMSEELQSRVVGSATLVPIPNSHVTSSTSPNFRTLALAEAIAAASGGRFVSSPALVFSEAQQSARRGGSRSLHHLEAVYRIAADVRGPIVLIDDVTTTGNHLVAACHKLNSNVRDVVMAATFGRSTKEQAPNPLEVCTEDLALTPTFFAFPTT